MLEKGKYIAIKCHNTPVDNDSGSCEINLSCYGGGSTEEWLVWKDKLLKVLDRQGISTWPLRYSFTERLLIGDAKATLNQAALDIGICTFGNDQTCISSICFPRTEALLTQAPNEKKEHETI